MKQRKETVWTERARMEETFARSVLCPHCDALPGWSCRGVPQSPALRARGERGPEVAAHVARANLAKKTLPIEWRTLKNQIIAMVQKRIDEMEGVKK